MKKDYYSEINVARGIGALIVLLGHSFPDAEIGVFSHPGYEWIYDLCYSFHMALFFWISGFVIGRKFYTADYSFCAEAIKKVKRLLIPYVFLSYLSLLPKIVLNAYARNPVDTSSVIKVLFGQSPNGSLWYLYTLFLFSLLALGLGKAFGRFADWEKSGWLVITGLLTYVFYLYAGDLALRVLFVDKINKYLLFYVLGIVSFRGYARLRKIYYMSAAFFAMMLVLALTCPYLSLRMEYGITAFCGIYAVIVVADRIKDRKEKIAYRFLDHCGSYSYDIYILSYYVQQMIRVVCFRQLGWDYAIVFLFEAIMGFSLSYLFAVFIVRKSRILKCLMIGMWEE
ncbi:MAG: acyltransferase [Lachnospiraceae bacterium]|nr:acyltransferase [Lachnospiraceae bacterium]